MSLIDHAKRELKILGYIPLDQEQEDGPNKWIQENILELIEVFSRQGHSGFSASYLRSLLPRLLKQEPISPLTGEDSEWNEVSNGLFQNNRCSYIFKENGKAYTTRGRIFSDNDGKTWFTSKGSHVEISFPYTIKDPEKMYLPKKENKEFNE